MLFICNLIKGAVPTFSWDNLSFVLLFGSKKNNKFKIDLQLGSGKGNGVFRRLFLSPHILMYDIISRIPLSYAAQK